LRTALRRFEAFAPPPRRRKAIHRARVGGVVIDQLRSTTGSRRHLLYLPGGAFIVRTPRWHRSLFTRLCAAVDASGSLAFYRLAPEYPYPAGLEDCVGSYLRLLESGVRPDDVVLGGDSAGGGLALTVMMTLRNRGLPLPARAFLMSPLADLNPTWSGSRLANQASDPLVGLLKGAGYEAAYLSGGRGSPEDPLVSPIHGSFAGLPPLLIQASRTEILLDDSVRTAQRARADGVDCTLELFDGLPHVWQLISWLPETKAALQSISQFAREPRGTIRG
jgi:acetyl esterase/lipase